MSDRFAALALPVDEAGRMIIMHPITGQPLRTSDGSEGYIDLLSNDSQKAQAFDRRQTTQRLQRRNRVATLTGEELEAEVTDRFAALTTGWSLVGLDGAPIAVDFSEAAARELYAAPAMVWLREQVALFQANRANFGKASSNS
jgi:hypothetical protein